MNFEKDKYIGYVEMALGIGDMIGPAIGGVVYDIYGFVGAFTAFGIMIFIGIVLSVALIPKSLNITSFDNSKVITDEADLSDDSSSEKSERESSPTSYVELTYKEFFNNYECCVCLVSACFAVIFTLYIDCVLSI